MKTALLTRLETSDEGTFGVIEIDGVRLFTGELPWRDDDKDRSCIPPGEYPCVLTFSNHFKKNLYLVKHTDARTGVRIHGANLCGDVTKGFRSQLLGCIALGEKLGRIGNQKAVLVSQSAVRKFMKALNNEPFTLEIKDVGTHS